MNRRNGIICVLGATGYVGGRLVPTLLKQGWRIRAVGRSIEKLACRPFASDPRCEIVAADLFDTDSVRKALDGCHAAFYLVHSMQGRGDFAAKDRQAAHNMVQAAEHAAIERIIYLGGLIPDDPDISHHLQSRAEVGDILASGPVPCTRFRAGVILGSGSASFEIVRYLVDRLPAMVTPKWVRTESQPISIRDVLFYLSESLDHPETIGEAFDIGGPHIETYERLFRIYQEEAGLKKRLIVPVPFLSPKLSSYWLGFVSPIPVALARPLVLGLKNRVVCKDTRIRHIMPCELSDARTTIRRALEKVKQHTVTTCWSDAGAIHTPEWIACGDAPYAGGAVFESAYRIKMEGCPDALWSKIVSIGGDNGWYCCNRLWGLRGMLDRLFGGVGLRRGRRDPEQLAIGDALDFWRVIDIQPAERLLLLAEMKLPGEALLEFTMEQSGTDNTQLTMTAKFLPRGVAGLAYWWSVYPLHALIFKGMISALAEQTGCTILDGPFPVDKTAPKCHIPQTHSHQGPK
ncbi:DUF2867 domain-containing protein [Pseudodesulfovibrio sp. JC047]|uniref:DUF2867 domain-containing protein n=1 Tax=Pseudodesulfovibrio sp. JC047 TaxID=2683199 RepID=UPI0013D810F3|nr:DUF2867 domain-containing protein [Pseudodesulfovibrio sp. JC047]